MLSSSGHQHKNDRHHLAQDFSQLFPIHEVLVFERENPAATVIVAEAATWIFGCQEVLRDQRQILFVVLG